MSLKYNAYIRYFDNLSGRGVVTVPALQKDFSFTWSADSRLDKYKNPSLSTRNGKDFITYNHLDTVEVEIYKDSHFQQVSKIRPKNWITKRDLLSDKLLLFLNSTSNCSESWSDHCLNNILTSIDSED